MSLGLAVRRLIPQPAKNFLPRRTLPWRVSRQISPYLPATICVNAGASDYPHGKRLAFLNAPATQWLAVKPNEGNIGYGKSWTWPCQVSACTSGLSRAGGTQTLFVTNVDTGSNLLHPEITPSMEHRVTKLGYFFQVTERSIETLTLVQAVAGLSVVALVFVKFDTQGAQPLFDVRRIVGIETESTLLAQSVMKGSGNFWQTCEYLEQQGFELLHIKPIGTVARSGRARTGRNTYLNECDAVFVLRQDMAASLPVDYRTSLLAFYLTNLFYEEALSLLERDAGVAGFLHQQDCSVDALVATLKAAV